MQKDALVERVQRSVAPFAQVFTISSLDTLIQSGLVCEGERLPNEGRKPRYDFGKAHFRRCLQVLRFRRQGLRRDDSVRVALFVAGYGVPPHEVREALIREYSRALKRLVARVRTKAADDWGDPTPGQRAALDRGFGGADGRLLSAELVPSADALLTLYRWARVSHLALRSGQVRRVPLPPAIAALPPKLQEVLRDFLVRHMAGVWAESGETRPTLGVELPIRSTPDADFVIARMFFQLLKRLLRTADRILRALRVPEGRIQPIAEACHAVAISLSTPEWRSAVFVVTLLAVGSSETETADLDALTAIACMSTDDLVAFLKGLSIENLGEL